MRGRCTGGRFRVYLGTVGGGTVPNQIGRLAYPPLAAEDAEIQTTPKANPLNLSKNNFFGRLQRTVRD